MKQALEMALEALEWFTAAEQGDEPPINNTITAIKEALAQPEQCDCPKEGFCGSGSRCQDAQPKQETCKGCNGNGMVGNILDTVLCPFCKGTGIEAQPEQEPVAIPQFRIQGSSDWYDGYPDYLYGASVYETRTLYTTPPQRKPLTDEQITTIARNHWGYAGMNAAEISFARAIEAAHNIKE